MINAELIMLLMDIESDDCVVWPKGTDSCGYSKVWYKGRHEGGHRIVLSVVLDRELLHDEWALHTCDNPPCVNRKHIVLGDQKSNLADMYTKGRDVQLKGSEHGRAKFDETIVRAIKKLHRQSVPIADIARQIDAPYTRVWMVCRNKNWRHIS